LSWQWLGAPSQRLRVAAQAVLIDGYHDTPLTQDASGALRRRLPVDALHLPAGTNPRSRQWLAHLQKQAHWQEADASKKAAYLMAHIRTGGYRYTLEPGSYGANAVDAFWLDRKAGFCEHFAASTAFLLRAWGVPARVVTGYQGGQWNTGRWDDAGPDIRQASPQGYYIVRNSNAHAWVEYWTLQSGWVRLDPTSAVDPARIEATRVLSLPPNPVVQAWIDISPGTWQRLRGLWDGVNHRWNQWVLNYSGAQQMDLLRKLGMSSPDWTALTRLLAWGFGLLCLAGWAVMVWQNRKDPWTVALGKLHTRVNRVLQAHGLMSVPVYSTPAAAARALIEVSIQSTVLPMHKAQIHTAVLRLQAWDAWRYGPQTLSQRQRWSPRWQRRWRWRRQLFWHCHSCLDALRDLS
jgi:protein-glutamine gamma-glutamyltransferase